MWQGVQTAEVYPTLHLTVWLIVLSYSVSYINPFHEMLPEPVFLNVYGAQESIPRNEFRTAYVAWLAGIITLFLLGS
jgi:hypothetical protein